MGWLLMFLSGCGQANLAEECNRVVAVINPNMATMASLTRDDVQGTHLTHLEQTATAAATQARSLAEDLRSRPLREHSLRYAELSNAVALQSEMLADRMAAAEAMEQAAMELEASLSPAIAAISLTCQAPVHGAACLTIQQTVANLPAQFNNDMLQQVATLRTLASEHAALQAPLTRLSNTLQQAAALQARITSAQDTITDARQAMELLEQGQAALINEINQTCM